MTKLSLHRPRISFQISLAHTLPYPTTEEPVFESLKKRPENPRSDRLPKRHPPHPPPPLPLIQSPIISYYGASFSKISRNAARTPLSSPAPRATSAAVFPSPSRVARRSAIAAAAAPGSLARLSRDSNSARAAPARPCSAAQWRQVQPSWSLRSTRASRSSTSVVMSASPTYGIIYMMAIVKVKRF